MIDVFDLDITAKMFQPPILSAVTDKIGGFAFKFNCRSGILSRCEDLLLAGKFTIEMAVGRY